AEHHLVEIHFSHKFNEILSKQIYAEKSMSTGTVPMAAYVNGNPLDVGRERFQLWTPHLFVEWKPMYEDHACCTPFGTFRFSNEVGNSNIAHSDAFKFDFFVFAKLHI